MPEKVKTQGKPSRVEVEFLEALRRRCPDHEPLLEALGHLYTRHGRFAEGLDVDLRLTRISPTDPENWYNLACSFALTRQNDRAISALRKAVALGYSDVEWMQSDEDLASLRDQSEFGALVEQARARVSARP
jgi:predicted Zn-dependent protease